MLTRAAELLVSFPESDDDDDALTDVDSPMSDAPPRTPTALPQDATEARLEAREAHKFLLAKSFFDCREYDRCAAVFIPGALPKGSTLSASPPAARSTAKGKAKQGTPTKAKSAVGWVQALSQKSLFLALYAKYLAGERRVNEDSEVILGPRDGGVVNGELQGISVVLEEWFSNLPSSGRQPQGWLEYLYGIVLAKGKNESLAKDYFIRSVTYYTFNWAAWQELASLLGTAEEVSTECAAQHLS
jgi:anaphase-promoting complex subunit 8